MLRVGNVKPGWGRGPRGGNGGARAWQSTAVTQAKMATMLSRAVSLAENLGRLSGPKVRQAGGFFRVYVNRAAPTRSSERAGCPEINTDRPRGEKEGEREREGRASASETERRSPIAILDSCSLLNRAPGSRAIRSRGCRLGDFPPEDRRDSYATDRGTAPRAVPSALPLTGAACQSNYRSFVRGDTCQTVVTGPMTIATLDGICCSCRTSRMGRI